jgi:quercetin dioxygenase-like cupin family protein
MRRVVTGHDGEGRSVVVSDGEVTSLPFGEAGRFHLAWTRSGRWDPAQPPGGVQLTVFELAAGGTRDLDRFVVESMTEFADASRPGMHATPTVDLDIVVSGVVGLELEGGEVRLEAGDVVVQNGTLHRWHNRGDSTAVIAAIAMGERPPRQDDG